MDRCQIVNGILHPCETMDKALQENYTAKGIGYLEIRNLTTRKVTKSVAVIHSGNLPKQGLVANFCPFCGADISHHVRGDDASAEQSASSQAETQAQAR